MFQSDRYHVILSTIGALLLSATCVVAAVGPARALADTAGATALRY
jgi:hypothetical protein